MALLKMKSSVVVPPVVVIAAAAINAANSLGLKPDLVITSGNDGEHMPGSAHYRDAALDFRTKTFTTDEKHALASAIQARLGGRYDVILEDEGLPNEHLHVELDQKAGDVVEAVT